MSYQNRVDPWGRLHAAPERGTYVGNRGIIHDERRTIVAQWRSKAWITCRLAFGNRRRTVFCVPPKSWTELFFIDEASAFAAGHWPCAECWRYRYRGLNSHWFVTMADAKREIEAWRRDDNEGRPQEALGNRTPKEFSLAGGTCAVGKSDEIPETLNQSGTNSG